MLDFVISTLFTSYIPLIIASVVGIVSSGRAVLSVRRVPEDAENVSLWLGCGMYLLATIAGAFSAAIAWIAIVTAVVTLKAASDGAYLIAACFGVPSVLFIGLSAKLLRAAIRDEEPEWD